MAENSFPILGVSILLFCFHVQTVAADDLKTGRLEDKLL